ncbi:MAG: HDOD domain-containing protein [Methylophilaceae bacterium]
MAETFYDIPKWIDFFTHHPIPVLKHTARELERLQEDESRLSAREITSIVLNDPFMVFRVISFAKQHQGRHQLQDLIQVEQAILMMGTDAFYRNLPASPLVEDQLQHEITALTHLLRSIKRAHRAAYFASNWAAMHKDLHSEEVRIAALLHDLAEMLMWCFAPDKMNAIFDKQHADRTLRSKVIQEEVLGFKLVDLQKELVEIFQLPPLLSKLMEDQDASDHRAINVSLAVNLARHSANGWDDAALPDDYQGIADFLHVDVDRVKFLIGVPVK